MIITKTPLRITLAGGGTDLPLFTSQNIGRVIPMAINQYIYTYIFDRPENALTIVQSSNLQEVKINSKIKHNIIREVLKYFNISKKLHVGFFSTIPTRSGVGSSSSLVVGLINSICKHKNIKYSKKKISKIAIKIERKILKEKGGIQDQISATYGGIILIECYKNFKFKVKNIIFSRKNIKFLEDHLILIYSDITRFSSDIHSSQNKKKNIKSYHEVRKEVKDIIDIIKKNSAKRLGIAFNNHWQRKRKLSKKMTSIKLDNFYKSIIKNGNFYGGKLIGAGGGGFFLFTVKNKKKAEIYLKKEKFTFTNIKIDVLGSRSIVY